MVFVHFLKSFKGPLLCGGYVAVWNKSKQTHHRNKSFRTWAKEEKADRGQHPKRKTRGSSMKLNFYYFNFISCDFQILENLFTPKFFRKVFLVLNLGVQAKNKQFI